MAILVLGAGVLFFFWQAFFGPYVYLDANPFHFDPWQTYATEADLSHKTYRTDSFETYLPRRYELTRAIRASRFPLWNPYIFGGMPFFADPQSRVLYPLSLAFVPIDPLTSMTYDVAIHIFLAALGMYFFARKIGLSRQGSVLSSFAYSFSSYFYSRIGHSTFVAAGAWLPFFFYGYERVRRASDRVKRIRSVLLLTIFLVFGYLAGFPQVYVFGVMSLLAYGFYLSIFEGPSKRVSNLLDALRIFGLSGGLAILIVSVQLIPFVELYRNSTGLRISLEDMTRFHVAPMFVLLKVMFPGLFGNPVEGTQWDHMTSAFFRPGLVHFSLFCGVGSFMLAVVAIAALNKNPRVQILAILLIGSTLLAVSPHLTALIYKISPIFRASRIERISVIGCFSMSALAGIGFDRLTEIQANSGLRKRAMAVIAGLVCLCLCVGLFWQIKGEDLLIKVGENARKTTAYLWGKIHAYTRSSQVKQWIDGDIDGWLRYERKQVAKGIILVTIFGFLLWLAVGHNLSSTIRKPIGIAIVGLVCIDVWFTARNYLILQVPDCLFETRSIKLLAELVSGESGWRIRTVYHPGEDIEVLPPNTNQIFGIQSLNGLCTIVPQGYTDFQNAYTEFILPKLLRNREAPLDPADVIVSNLGCARYILCNRHEKVFLPNPIFNLIGASQQTARLIRIANLGGTARLAFNQPEAQPLNMRIETPRVRFLDMGFGFNSDASSPGDTLVCSITCKKDDSQVAFEKGFDLYLDRGSWHPIRIDISKVSGGSTYLKLGWVSSKRSKNIKVNAFWAGFDLVYGDCAIFRNQDGEYIVEGDLGESICVSLESDCKEVPLEVIGDSGSRRIIWVAFTSEMPSREITLDFNQPDVRRAVVRSDSGFVLNRARSVYISKVYQGFSLIYDKDMLIYENHNAIRRGVCLDRHKVETKDGTAMVSQIDNLADIECGKCKIVDYQPEKIVVDVISDRDCLLLFQDVWYPGWKAIVDGSEKPILKTDIGIRAIDLDKGRHRIEMIYKPKSLRLGLGLTLLGIAIGLVLGSGFDPSKYMAKIR